MTYTRVRGQWRQSLVELWPLNQWEPLHEGPGQKTLPPEVLHLKLSQKDAHLGRPYRFPGKTARAGGDSLLTPLELWPNLTCDLIFQIPDLRENPNPVLTWYLVTLLPIIVAERFPEGHLLQGQSSVLVRNFTGMGTLCPSCPGHTHARGSALLALAVGERREFYLFIEVP